MTELRKLELRNDQLHVVVVPELGGRVSSLIDVASGREWLWRNERVELGPSELGANYDDRWQGGSEELFPNDAATQLDGVDLPDHGELWSATWDVVAADEHHLELRTTGPVTGVSVIKAFTLDGPELDVSYTLTNPGDEDIQHLFKLHPAIAVHEACRIELPGGQVEPVDPEFSRILPGAGRWEWPGPEGHDLSRCHGPDSGLQEFVYVHDLPDGWCAVTDERLGRRLRLTYPRETFPYCWLFITYGGWRHHQVVVLEPCTNHPKDLHEAIENGTSATLAAGATQAFSATFGVEDA